MSEEPLSFVPRIAFAKVSEWAAVVVGSCECVGPWREAKKSQSREAPAVGHGLLAFP